MKNTLRSTIVLAALTIAMGANAAQYAVQIGAHKLYKQASFDAASQHGTVHTDKSYNVTKVRVGFFHSKEGAQGLLNELKQAGYEDAFVTEIEPAPLSTTKAGDTSRRPVSGSKSGS